MKQKAWLIFYVYWCHTIKNTRTDLFVCIGYQPLAEFVLSIADKVNYASQATFRQDGFFIQVNYPTVVQISESLIRK